MITAPSAKTQQRTRDYRSRAHSIVFATIASLAATHAVAVDDPHSFSANIGAVSNYIWRGVSQTDDGPAIQGGLDYAHESGFYVGTWASNVDFGADEANYELDLYGGFDFSLPAEDASLGINTIYYAYPDGDSDIDFWEIGISGGFKWFSAGIQYTAWGDEDNDDALFDDGDFYYYGGFDIGLPRDFGLGLRLGYYDFTNDDVVVNDAGKTESADYFHWGLTVSKEAGDFGTFSFNYDQNDGDDKVGYDDDAKIWVGWSKEF